MAHFHAASCMGVIKVPEAGQRGAEGREGVMEEEEWRIFHHPAIVFPLFAIGIVQKWSTLIKGENNIVLEEKNCKNNIEDY